MDHKCPVRQLLCDPVLLEVQRDEPVLRSAWIHIRDGEHEVLVRDHVRVGGRCEHERRDDQRPDSDEAPHDEMDRWWTHLFGLPFLSRTLTARERQNNPEENESAADAPTLPLVPPGRPVPPP